MVTIKDLYKTYVMGKVKVNALNGIDLEVNQGDFTAVMGSSGSGKSSLLHIMGGIDTPTAGEVWIDGKCLSRMEDTEATLFRRTNIGFVFQFFNLMTTLTIEENITLPLQIANLNARSQKGEIRDLLQFVGLYDRRHHKPHQLSGGEQQRAAIARALATEPKIILLDEPTGSLDSKNSEKILELLRRSHHEFKTTIVMITHNPIAAESADWTVFMKDGLIAASLKKGGKEEYSNKTIYEKMSSL